jgi:FtsP/CotA-like multicopper oxidase with cupredoxin domain
MDGVPALTQPEIAVGSSFDYRFKVPDAGTFWYHPPSTLSGQSERGLYGMLIVDEEAPLEVDRDIPFVIDHRPLRQTISTKANERLRLRLLNAATGRITRLRFDRHPVRVMAIDGQPAEPFLAKEGRIMLAPGNRIDVFLDAVLDPGESASFFADEKEFAQLIYHPTEKRRAAQLPEPRPLPPNPLPPRIDMRNALRNEIPLGGGAASQAKPGTPGDPLSRFGPSFFSVKRGRAVVMAFPNATDAAYAVHIHGHHVRLLDQLDDGWKPFWLDTVTANPGRTTRVAFVADNPGQWLVYGQPLAGSPAPMAEWFEVT